MIFSGSVLSVQATASQHPGRPQVSPNRKYSRPLCSNELPRSVARMPNRFSVRLSVGIPAARSKSPVNWQTLFVEAGT
jgi:hypothetical protein